MRPRRVLTLAIVGLLCLAAAAAGDGPGGAIAPTGSTAAPPMGVSSWNATGCSDAFNEAWVRAQADALVRTGLREDGYRYVNLDDCWGAARRDPAGRLVADPVRFPHGIAALADYAHARGLLLGVYASAGTRTCDPRGFPGSLGHERVDADSLAAWRVDYLKYDDCFGDGTSAAARYSVMAAALRAAGRPIVLSVCDRGSSAPWLWAPGIGGLWRTGPDIADTWPSVADIIRRSLALVDYARPGGWNDPDGLEIGNGGLAAQEERTQLAVWAVLSAPLLAGTDLARADAPTLALLANPAVIAIDQDSRAPPPRVDRDGAELVVLRRGMSDGTTATAVVNLGQRPEPAPAWVTGTDLLSGVALAPGADVAPHATALVRR